MHFGLSAIRHRFTPGTDLALTSNTQLGEDLRLDADRIKSQKQFSSYTGHELRSYLENQWIFGTTLVINAGAHFSRIGVGGQNYQYIEPRLAARINFSDKAFIGFAYSEMDQYMHLLSTSGLGLPNDVWIPATSQIKPQYARHLSIQLQWELLPSVRMDLSAFDRNTDRIRSLREGAVFNIQEGYDWQENLPTGESKSRGVELSMERREGNPRFWANYSWTKTEDLFETLNSGLAFRSRNDRRHMANTGMIIAVNQNLEFSFAWTYRSGTPITLPVFFQPVPIDNGIEIIPKYGPIHNAELPQYHRLDVGVNLYNDYSWGKQKLSIGAYNAYARSNPFYVDIVRDIKDPSTLQLEQVSLFPFVPYVNFSLTF